MHAIIVQASLLWVILDSWSSSPSMIRLLNIDEATIVGRVSSSSLSSLSSCPSSPPSSLSAPASNPSSSAHSDSGSLSFSSSSDDS